MNVPTWAGLVADFPDDQVATTDNILVYGGHNVAVALGRILTDLGCTNVAAPWGVNDVGWEFDFKYRGRHKFLCRIQSFHPVFWLLFEGPSDTRKGAAAYVELWRKFGSALECDSRFRKVLWRSFEEGPPHWHEVEAASDPPQQSFAERFAAVEFNPGAPKPGCLSILVAAPLIFWGAPNTVWLLFFSHRTDRWDVLQMSIAWLVVGLTIYFWSRIRWWIDNFRS